MFESDFDAETIQQFNKRYCFTKTNDNWVLPPANELWTESEWWDETLLSMKDRLNSVKNLLNDKERGPWSEHTQSLNPAGNIVSSLRRRCKPELCTQAWAKCFEIMTKYEEYFFPHIYGSQLHTIHLCEAPGAFITALNQFIFSRLPEKQKDWKWIATTLNPYYEGNSQSCMINDDRFILNTLENWEFGADNTGNIMHHGNLEKLKLRANELGEISLITADGSIGCHDNPSEQEGLVSTLHFCEVITACNLLKNNGNFVVKMFTFFECRSISLLYLLNCLFRDVHLFKPVTSKEGNSEVYVICIGFEEENFKSHENQLKLIFDSEYHNKVLLQRKHIPQDFLDHLYASSKLFTDQQMSVIERNVRFYENIDITMRQHFDDLQSKCLHYYLNVCNVHSIDDNHLIVPRKRLKVTSPDLYLRAMDITFNSLQKRKCMSLQEKVLEMEKELRGFMHEKWTPEDIVYNQFTVDRNSWPGREWHLNLDYAKCGKSFHRIQSSRFSCQFLINLWNETVEEKQISKQKCNYPVDFLISLMTESNCQIREMVVDISSSEYEETSVQSQHNIRIVNLKNIQKSTCVNMDNALWIEALIFIEENINCDGNIFLLCDNLTTRFIVGCFYILFHYFGEVTLFRENCLPPHNQSTIIRARKYKIFHKSTSEFLQKIRQKLMSEESEKSILEIVPVHQLICDHGFYNNLYDFNKRKLAQQLHHLFKEIKD